MIGIRTWYYMFWYVYCCILVIPAYPILGTGMIHRRYGVQNVMNNGNGTICAGVLVMVCFAYWQWRGE